ncbi:hypothetical protein V8B55DRAFT_1351436 [Mucor lusitanicus]|uniref:Uncharacterized protein n=2 Tax=Mucor circinelloides f. lusitanicus TaxID=29924 RepID=A0A162TWX0_MUCCL|nr:hypothetical protein FB192DRAFT_1457894 [Mucor lusitanicus]OAD07782.1 hypothetical protein MUCCIDRAFT_104722 [Mucor lusitanicus CBS 277.49]
MLKFASLILGVFFSAVVSAVANENVQILAEESISIIPGPDGRNVIPVVQTIDGTITTFYYTIIGEQTIVNGEQSTTLDGADDDLAEYPNIANALRNMDAFEDMLARILQQNPEFGMLVDSQSEPHVSASASASVSS